LILHDNEKYFHFRLANALFFFTLLLAPAKVHYIRSTNTKQQTDAKSPNDEFLKNGSIGGSWHGKPAQI